MKPKPSHLIEPMTDFESKALATLAACSSLVRPGHFGSLLWPGNKKSGGQHNGSAPLARPAGKVLNRLKTLGLAEYIYEHDRELTVHKDGSMHWSDWGWRATLKGQKHARYGR